MRRGRRWTFRGCIRSRASHGCSRRPRRVSERLPRTSARLVLAALKRAGWVEIRQAGSHVRLRHPNRSEDVTIAMHGGTMPLGTLRSVINQTGLSVQGFKDLLRCATRSY
ncbi:MAG: type II toxin-antitoxin system HicA family toxin [Thermomicrobiales bacterium]